MGGLSGLFLGLAIIDCGLGVVLCFVQQDVFCLEWVRMGRNQGESTRTLFLIIEAVSSLSLSSLSLSSLSL